MDRSATIARGLLGIFFGDGTMAGIARCAATCDPTNYPRDAAALRLLSKLDLPLEIVRLVGEFAVQSPLARFSMVGRVDGAVLARLLRPHIDGVVGKLKRTKHFGRVVAVARGAAVAAAGAKAAAEEEGWRSRGGAGPRLPSNATRAASRATAAAAAFAAGGVSAWTAGVASK